MTASDVATEAIAEDTDVERLGKEVDEIERVVRDDVSRVSEAPSLDLSRSVGNPTPFTFTRRYVAVS